VQKQLDFQGYNISCRHTFGQRLSTVSSEIAGFRVPSEVEEFCSSLILFTALLFLQFSL
jgi:hypothetical protein